MNKEYALYKGDELLDMGTLDYLSKKVQYKAKITIILSISYL